MGPAEMRYIELDLWKPSKEPLVRFGLVFLTYSRGNAVHLRVGYYLDAT